MKQLAIFIVAISFRSAIAQPIGGSYINVTGKIEDTAGAYLSNATVRLTAGVDTFTKISLEDGSFSFTRVRNKQMRLYVTTKGYLPFSQTYEIPALEFRLALKPIILHADYSELSPVVVENVRPIVFNGDTLSYNMSAFKVPNGSMVEDMLKKLPGIEVDMDGNVIVQGKPVGKVLVNGKEFFGGDVLLAIQNLPVDLVKSLQIIDDYGDKARLTGIRTDEPTKILNIVFKPSTQNGEFGHAEAGVGLDDKYAENAFGNYFAEDRQLSLNANIGENSLTGKDPSRGLTTSYADQWGKKWAGGIKASTTADNPQVTNSLWQHDFYPGQEVTLQESTSSKAHNQMESGGGLISYKPDNYTTLRITPSFKGQRFSQESLGTFSTLLQDSGQTKTTKGQTTANNSSQSWNAAADLYFEKTLPASNRRLSLHATATYIGDRSLANTNTITNGDLDSLASQSLVNYLTSNSNHTLNLNLSTNYFLPVGHTAFFEIGYNFQSQNLQSDRITQTPDSTASQLVNIDSLSQNGQYLSLWQQFHTGYSAHFSNVDLTFTVNGQPGMLSDNIGKAGEFTYRYFTFLPEAQARWKIAPHQTLTAGYNGYSNLPSFQQISPITDFSNPQYPVTGNPTLRPSYTHAFSAQFEKVGLQQTRYSSFSIGLSYDWTVNTIATSITYPKKITSVVETTNYINAGSISSLSLNYNFALPAFIQKKLRITTNGGFIQTQCLTFIDGKSYKTDGEVWTQAIHLQLVFPNLAELELQGNYSLTHTAYALSSQLPSIISTAILLFGGKYYPFPGWVLSYRLTQPFATSGRCLQRAPTALTSTLQKDFLPNKKISLALTGYNLFNSPSATTGGASPTSITRSTTVSVGRYFMFTCIFKFSRFKKH